MTPTPYTVANRGVVQNNLILWLNRYGGDLSRWTRSSWSVATGALAASWARSSWSCSTCTALGDAIDPTRSSWSRSSWSSFGEDAEIEAAQEDAENAAPPAPAEMDTPEAAAPAEEVAP
jgi:serine protease AprX